MPTRSLSFESRIGHPRIAYVFGQEGSPVTPANAGDERVSRPTTPDVGVIATCSHRGLARGLDGTEAAKEVGDALFEAFVDEARGYREVRAT